MIGFLLALPVGPTMVLCIRYSLSLGMLVGLVTGAGAAFADAVYGVFAGYGIYAIVHFIEKFHFAFHMLGSAILCYLGIKTLKEHYSLKEGRLKRKPHLAHLFATTFTLTATSPLTFVGVSALCAAFGIADYERSWLSPWMLGAGLFIGSCLWWQILSLSLAVLRRKITSAGSEWIGRISGSILLLLGVGLFIYSLIES